MRASISSLTPSKWTWYKRRKKAQLRRRGSNRRCCGKPTRSTAGETVSSDRFFRWNILWVHGKWGYRAGTPYLWRHLLGKEAAAWLPAEVKSLHQGHAQGQIHTSLQQARAQTETDVEKQTVKAPGAAFLWELKGTVTCRDLGLKERGSEHQKSPRNQQRPVCRHEYAWWPAGALLGGRRTSSHTSCLDMKGNVLTSFVRVQNGQRMGRVGVHW